eukprot:9388024-Lingulodinium_polyedra.AAC.1
MREVALTPQTRGALGAPGSLLQGAGGCWPGACCAASRGLRGFRGAAAGARDNGAHSPWRGTGRQGQHAVLLGGAVPEGHQGM